MKNKLPAVLAAAALCMQGVAVFAQNDSEISVYRDGETIVAKNISADANRAVLNIYDDGKLKFSVAAAEENDEYIFNVPNEYDGMRMRICYIGDDTYEAKAAEMPTEAPTEIPTAEPTEAPTENPTAEPTEAPTENPTAEPTAKPTRKPVPAAYEKSLDALNAPAVVTDVYETIEDGETYHMLTMFYQGEEITAKVRDTVAVKSAPAAESYLTGSNASSLKEGDVIHFTNDLQGRIKSIEFIYRPDFADYVGENVNFAAVCGRDGYSTFKFGVPVDKSRGTVSLADANGKVTEIDVNEKAFIYTVSDKKRRDIVSLEGTGAGIIPTVYIAKSNFDDNGDVISWDDTDDIIYAIARVVNGSATEIIIFGE